MIVTVLLLCGGIDVLYIMLIQLLKARFGGMPPQENFEKIVSFGALLFISGSDFVLNNFKK